MNRLAILVLAIAVSGTTVPALAQKLDSADAPMFWCNGRSADGDTIDCYGAATVRLHGIDAPELDQPYGVAASKRLQALVAGADRIVCRHLSDKNQKRLATCVAVKGDAGVDLGETLIK